MELQQPGFNTTMMGALLAACRHLGIEVSDVDLFGNSGHAFLMNLHPELCPSGPYCFNLKRVFDLLQNVGLEVVEVGSVCAADGERGYKSLEDLTQNRIAVGEPCILLSLEFQAVLGVDIEGVHLARPWPGNPSFPPGLLTTGSWKELGETPFGTVFACRRTSTHHQQSASKAALQFAVTAARDSDYTAYAPYVGGLAAYPVWVNAIKNGAGSSHGHWWNGQVWSECRRMAAKYINNCTSEHPQLGNELTEIAGYYALAGTNIQSASAKDMPAEQQIALLEAASSAESKAIGCLEKLQI